MKIRKMFVFSDNMILYLENPKKLREKLLERINSLSKFIGYKVNI